MASLQASVRSLFPIAMDPGLLNERLNDALCRSSSVARYATAFLADFDPETRRMTYSNAGHLPGLVIRGAETIRCEEGGLPIGLFEGVKYETGSLALAQGDLLALFTDGVSEAPAPDGEEFGAERLADLLRGHLESPLDAASKQCSTRCSTGSGPIDRTTM